MTTKKSSKKELSIPAYNSLQSTADKKVCLLLMKEIDDALKKADRKVWHGGPVWFLDGNPVAGYWKRKQGVQLMFWSGWSFDEPQLMPIGNTKKYKAAGINYLSVKDVNLVDVKRWLRKSKTIQWDYKNIVKRQGKLVCL